MTATCLKNIRTRETKQKAVNVSGSNKERFK